MNLDPARLLEAIEVAWMQKKFLGEELTDSFASPPHPPTLVVRIFRTLAFQLRK